MIKKGDVAPDFEVLDHLGNKFRLSSERGKIVVLYFYPKAMTSGCTQEGLRFNALLPEFEKLGAVVYGISTDSVEDNRKFAEIQGFKFRLLCDIGGNAARAYGVLKESMGTAMAERVTFVIDESGKIVEVLRNIRPAEKHADEALRVVRELRGMK
ncbi:MAG: peroxiredoxin [Acidilobaceae archaeon]|nr:peroxiredoxin [Acidilobaceae archaeon]MCX8165399.1 peroxiredoxin [Acidilobaceae archaeon]MDW7973826.1 peroxiredoxin [Sulfolobales archaeon]